MESIQNIRTVIQLTKETHFYDQYSPILNVVYQYCYIFCHLLNDMIIYLFYRSSLKRIHILSILSAVSSSAFYFAITAFISLAVTLLDQNMVTFERAFM